jgi:hypothetical protein
MYVDTAKTVLRGKTYFRHLLRDSYRENGKVKHHTIANLSECSEEEIEAIKLALKYKGQLSKIGSIHAVNIKQGNRIGAVCFLRSMAEKINLIDALGNGQRAKMALWQIFSRIIDRGSRLNPIQLARKHSAFDLLELKPFNEDQLHENLIWLAEKQAYIEKYLFSLQFANHPPQLFFCNSTVSCLKDFENQKIDLFIGLFTDPEGSPVAVRLIEKNTPDVVTEQVGLLMKMFGVGRVIHYDNWKMPKQMHHDFVKSFGKQPVIKDHLISIMLSYLLEREIEKHWDPIDIPFDEGINELSSIRTVEITIAGTTYWKVPTPAGLCKELLDAANVKLPLMIPMKASLSNSEHNE